MRYPSCNAERKSSCKTQLLTRTRIKISLNKYKERVHEGEQPTGTGCRAHVSLHHPSPCGFPSLCRGQPSLGWDQQLRVTAPSDAICKQKELMHPCGPALALPHGPTGTGVLHLHSKRLGFFISHGQMATSSQEFVCLHNCKTGGR